MDSDMLGVEPKIAELAAKNQGVIATTASHFKTPLASGSVEPSP